MTDPYDSIWMTFTDWHMGARLKPKPVVWLTAFGEHDGQEYAVTLELDGAELDCLIPMIKDLRNDVFGPQPLKLGREYRRRQLARRKRKKC